MKTLSQIKETFKSNTLDGRDLTRLMNFIPEKDLKDFGIKLKDEYIEKHEHKELTKENILKELENDLKFAFEKALNRRGISSSMMFEVIKMWNWILEEGLENWNDDDYAMYGLPLYKATAIKYGFDNPIGDNTGDEWTYGDNNNE